MNKLYKLADFISYINNRATGKTWKTYELKVSAYFIYIYIYMIYNVGLRNICMCEFSLRGYILLLLFF